MTATPREPQGLRGSSFLIDSWRRLQNLAGEALALLADHLELFSLEARAALLSCLWAMAGVMAAVVLLLTAWGCLVAGLVVGLLSAGWSPVWVLLGVALVHGLAGLGLGVLAARRVRRRIFPDTLRLLRLPATQSSEIGGGA